MAYDYFPHQPNKTQFDCAKPGNLFTHARGVVYYQTLRTEPDTIIVCDAARSALFAGEPIVQTTMVVTSPTNRFAPLIEIYHAINANKSVPYAAEYEELHRALGQHVRGKGAVAISWVSGNTLLFTILFDAAAPSDEVRDGDE